MDPPYIVVSEKESQADSHFCRVPLSRDKKIHLTEIRNLFPGTVGLWFRDEATHEKEVVGLDENGYLCFQRIAKRYFCIYMKDDVDIAAPVSDLIALGLPSRVTRDDIMTYLKSFAAIDCIGKIEGSGPSKFVVFRCKDARSFWDISFRRHMMFSHWFYIRPLETLDIRGLGVGDILLVILKKSRTAARKSTFEDFHTCENILQKLAEKEICQKLNINSSSTNQSSYSPSELNSSNRPKENETRRVSKCLSEEGKLSDANSNGTQTPIRKKLRTMLKFLEENCFEDNSLSKETLKILCKAVEHALSEVCAEALSENEYPLENKECASVESEEAAALCNILKDISTNYRISEQDLVGIFHVCEEVAAKANDSHCGQQTTEADDECPKKARPARTRNGKKKDPLKRNSTGDDTAQKVSIHLLFENVNKEKVSSPKAKTKVNCSTPDKGKVSLSKVAAKGKTPECPKSGPFSTDTSGHLSKDDQVLCPLWSKSTQDRLNEHVDTGQEGSPGDPGGNLCTGQNIADTKQNPSLESPPQESQLETEFPISKNDCKFCGSLVSILEKGNHYVRHLLKRFAEEHESKMLEDRHRSVTSENLCSLLSKVTSQDATLLAYVVLNYKSSRHILWLLRERKELYEELCELAAGKEYRACLQLLQATLRDLSLRMEQMRQQLESYEEIEEQGLEQRRRDHKRHVAQGNDHYHKVDIASMFQNCASHSRAPDDEERGKCHQSHLDLPALDESSLSRYFSSKGKLLKIYVGSSKKYALVLFQNALVAQRWGYKNLDIEGREIFTQPVVLKEKYRTKFIGSIFL